MAVDVGTARSLLCGHRRGGRRRAGALLLLALLASPWLWGCRPTPTMIAGMPTRKPSPTATVTVAPTPAPLPAATATARPTLTPSPIPTIVIPILTRTPTPTPGGTPQTSAGWALPERVVPEPFGVEIHFTRASDREMDQLAAAGFRWVRMDMFWHTVEKTMGRYDFSEYDVLVNAMAQRGIRIVFILDYGNAIYDNGASPNSPGGRAAFARFAAAAARRYQGKGIIWEIWNEPNLKMFWYPEPNAQHYGLLAITTAKAIREVDPSALVVAPALSGYEWDYWHTLGQLGVFQHLDAITVHSYGVYQPEHILQPYLALRTLIDRYSPTWTIPVLSGEWGFSTTEGGMSETQQAQYLTRQWLFNLSHDINLSIWYDWHDDGPDPHNPEHHFGVVRHDYTAKPAYRAARTLLTTLDGYTLMRRVAIGGAEDYVLLFQKHETIALALWTTGEPHTLALPMRTGPAKLVRMTGEAESIESGEGGLSVGISQSPRYLIFENDPTALWLGGWRPENTLHSFEVGEAANVLVTFQNPFATPIYGTLEARALGEVRGSAPVNVPPGTQVQVRVPVQIEGLRGNVPAALRFVPEDEMLLPLQSAALWWQVREAATE